MPLILSALVLFHSQLLAASGQLFHLELHRACLLCHRGKWEGSTASAGSPSFTQASLDPRPASIPEGAGLKTMSESSSQPRAQGRLAIVT